MPLFSTIKQAIICIHAYGNVQFSATAFFLYKEGVMPV